MKTRTLRQILHLRLRRIFWPKLRRRSLFLLGGVTIGLLAALMAVLADKAQLLFFSVEHRWPLAPLIITPAGFALSTWLTRKYFNGAQGSGIPQVIAARQLADPKARAALVSIRIAIAKIGLLMLGLLAGASSGREGPTVQVGAATMFALGRLAPHRQPGLLLAGSAAGIAAAFNAPLAGIIFGIEEMSRSFEVRSSGLVLVTVITAGLTALAIFGDYNYFGIATGSLAFGWQWLAVPVVGIIGGVCGGLFSRVIILFADGLPGRIGQLIRRYPVIFAALCGLAVALCGVAAGGSIFGTGYEQSKAILAGDALPGLFGPLKLVATALSSISGIPGGIFSPSLAVGAGIAYDLSPLLPQVPIGVLAILCMSSYLAGVVQAPLTAFVIVGEMTADHALIFPIMICALIASAISRLICREGIYHALARRLTKGQEVIQRHA
ncbi:MAG TPA: chloride channel protein [Arsenicitalea sp.]|jgi:H+/Cl- antiporter ClcA|nr:chloride channel protein [Arsenicitalea sp.]